MMMSGDLSGADVPRNRLLRLDFLSSRWLHCQAGSRVPAWLLLGLEHSGHGLLWLPAVLLLVLWPGLHWQLRTYALNLEAGFLLDLAVVGALKLAVKRLRPSYTERQYSATVIADQYSFPSGHASRCALIAAMVFAFASGGGAAAAVWVALVAAWAVTTSASRIFLGRHYVADVLVGFVLGLALAGAMTKVCPTSHLPGRRQSGCRPALHAVRLDIGRQ